VTITAYRIVKKQFARSIWSGAGARDFGGRWNPKGVPVIYTAQSRSLGALEQLVHLIQPRILSGFVIASITFDRRRMQIIDIGELPRGWNRPVAPPQLKQLGLQWIAAARFPVLAVPSAVVPGEWNYLVNSAHPEFSRMRRSELSPFVYDRRLK
jgi:RES domain-containing protein